MFYTLFKYYWAHWANFRILSPKLCQKLCYFKLKINGDVIRHVIFEMNDKVAPVMTSKFLELCSGTLACPGYSGSKVFPVYPLYSPLYFLLYTLHTSSYIDPIAQKRIEKYSCDKRRSNSGPWKFSVHCWCLVCAGETWLDLVYCSRGKRLGLTPYIFNRKNFIFILLS